MPALRQLPYRDADSGVGPCAVRESYFGSPADMHDGNARRPRSFARRREIHQRAAARARYALAAVERGKGLENRLRVSFMASPKKLMRQGPSGAAADQALFDGFVLEAPPVAHATRLDGGTPAVSDCHF